MAFQLLLTEIGREVSKNHGCVFLETHGRHERRPFQSQRRATQALGDRQHTEERLRPKERRFTNRRGGRTTIRYGAVWKAPLPAKRFFRTAGTTRTPPIRIAAKSYSSPRQTGQHTEEHLRPKE